MDIYVKIGKTPDTIVVKNTIIVGLVGIKIMLEDHGVIYLKVGKDVTYQYVVVSKSNPIWKCTHST
jgi:hypothetical protein